MICLTAAETERRFQLLRLPNRFSDAERLLYITTPVVDDRPDLFAFPTPGDNSGLNILSLRKILGTNPSAQPAFFDHPWYLDEPFASVDCEAGWHILHMDVLAESISQPIHYRSSFDSRNLALPAAIEVTLMLFLHYVGSGAQLLLKKHTWCSDQASLDRFVTVGAFGRNGLFVSGHPAEFASRGLGICPKLTPPAISG